MAAFKDPEVMAALQDGMFIFYSTPCDIELQCRSDWWENDDLFFCSFFQL